jgi:hypothetical protein
MVVMAGIMLRNVVEPLVVMLVALSLFSGLMFVTRPFNKVELEIIERAVGARISGLFRAVASDRMP